jgi:AcrR family transcriptional regulator
VADETRERILDGTLELLGATNVTDFSMDRLAEWIGLSRKTIYNHFSGKAELISAAIAVGMERIVDTLSTIANDDSLGFVERLDQIVELGFREMRRLWAPIAGSAGPRSPMEVRTGVRELNRHLRDLIRGIVAEAAAAGLFTTEVDPHIFAHVILNMVGGIRCIDDVEALPCPPLELLRESLRVALVGALSPRGIATLQGSQILSAQEGQA